METLGTELLSINKGVRQAFVGGKPKVKYIHNRLGNSQDVTVICEGTTYACGGYWKGDEYHLSDIVDKAYEY